MHEETLVRDVQRKLGEIGRTVTPATIIRVQVWIGALGHLTEPTLRGRWAEMVRGTPAEGARLEVVTSEDVNDPRARDVVLVEVGLTEPGDRSQRAQEEPRR